jgi:hypothetical protein
MATFAYMSGAAAPLPSERQSLMSHQPPYGTTSTSYSTTTTTITTDDPLAAGNTFTADRRLCCCIRVETHKSVLHPTLVRLDRTTCLGCCGTARFSAEAADVTSAHAEARLDGCLDALTGCGAGSLRVRAGPEGDSGSALLFYRDVDAAADTVLGVTTAARTTGASLSAAASTPLPPGRWVQRSTCSGDTCCTCRERTTRWEVGPNPTLAARRTDEHCLFPCCDSSRSVSVARLDSRGEGPHLHPSHVAALVRYVPTGSCACVDSPVGTCTFAEFASVELKDGEVVYGVTAPGRSGEVLAATAAHLRPRGMPPERDVLQVRATDWCGREEAELTLTTDSVHLRTFTESACKRMMTGGCCAGEVTRSIRVEDVKGVLAEEPGVCAVDVRDSLLGPCAAVPRTKRWSLVLRGFLVFVFLLFFGITFGVFRNPVSFSTEDCSGFYPYRVCRSTTDPFAISFTITWMSSLVLAFLVSPTGLLCVPFTVLRFMARAMTLVAGTVCCWSCCCRQTVVRVQGPGGQELRLRPGADMGAGGPQQVATTLSTTLAGLKAAYAAARLAEVGGAPKMAGGGGVGMWGALTPAPLAIPQAVPARAYVEALPVPSQVAAAAAWYPTPVPAQQQQQPLQPQQQPIARDWGVGAKEVPPQVLSFKARGGRQ